MLIRRYEPGDKEAVWDLHNRALRAVGAHAGSGAWDDDLHSIAEHYLLPGGVFLVGTSDDGTVVAMGALEPAGPGEARVRRMRVAPECQRRGWGRRILAELEACAVRQGLLKLSLDTAVIQTAAQALYEGAGYRETGRGIILGFDVIYYEKVLGAAPAR